MDCGDFGLNSVVTYLIIFWVVASTLVRILKKINQASQTPKTEEPDEEWLEPEAEESKEWVSPEPSITPEPRARRRAPGARELLEQLFGDSLRPPEPPVQVRGPDPAAAQRETVVEMVPEERVDDGVIEEDVPPESFSDEDNASPWQVETQPSMRPSATCRRAPPAWLASPEAVRDAVVLQALSLEKRRNPFGPGPGR